MDALHFVLSTTGMYYSKVFTLNHKRNNDHLTVLLLTCVAGARRRVSPLVDNNPDNWLYTAAPVLLQPLASARTSTTTSVATGRPLVCWGSGDVSSVSYWWAESVSTHWRISPGRPSVRVTQWRCVAKIGKTGSGDFLACSEHPVLLTWQSSAQLGNGWPSFPVWRETLASSEGFPPDAQRTSQSTAVYYPPT